MTDPLLLAAAASMAATLALAGLLGPLAARLGLVDVPGGRKRHPRPVPLHGGMAVVWATLLVFAAARYLLVASPSTASRALATGLAGESRVFGAVAGGMMLLHVIGLWDDRRGVSPLAKLATQLGAATLVAVAGVRLLPTWLPVGLSFALTLVWIVAVINAFNFLDGADGLAAAVALACGGMFLVVAWRGGWPGVGLLLATLAGALIGFLPFNLPPAKVFLGDSGSQPVGFLLAYASVRLTYHLPGAAADAPWYVVFTPLLVLAIPLYDLVTVVALRLAQGRSPMVADNQHFLHRLAARDLSTRGVLLVVFAATLATGLGGVLLPALAPWQAILIVAQAAMVLLLIAVLDWRPAYLAVLESRRRAKAAAALTPSAALTPASAESNVEPGASSDPRRALHGR